jgi:hypothetical protein
MNWNSKQRAEICPFHSFTRESIRSAALEIRPFPGFSCERVRRNRGNFCTSRIHFVQRVARKKKKTINSQEVMFSDFIYASSLLLNKCKILFLCLPANNNDSNLDLVQVCLKRKVGRDGLGTFAAFRMLLAKIGAKICCCFQLESHASVGKTRR